MESISSNIGSMDSPTKEAVCVRTLNLEQAADFLKINLCTAQKMAASGELPGAKIGRAWVFLEDDLAGWLREQIQIQQQQRCSQHHSSKTSLKPLSQVSTPQKTKRGKRPRQPPVLPELPRQVGST